MKNESRQSTIHDPRYKELVQALTAMRKKANLSQSDLAKSLGFSQSDISKIENCERRIDVIEVLDWQEVCSSDLIKLV